MPVVIGILSAVATAAAVLFGFGYYAYRTAFYNNPKKNPPNPYRHVKDDGSEESAYSKRLIDEMIARPAENVYITSRDGLKLRARLYMQNENAPFAIAMHGYRSTPMLDFSGGGALALELGLNLLMPDQRACGESEGKCVSFGYNESLDTLDWVRFVTERFGAERKIVLLGVSLGAGTVIMTAGMGVPENVLGVIADCTFSSAKKIIMKVMKDRGIPQFLYPILRFGTLVYGGFDPNKAEPRALASKIKIPLMLVHGEDDSFVPPEMSREIYEAADGAELHTVPGARHGTSYIADTERYKRITADFLLRIFGEGFSQKTEKKGEKYEA